MKSSIVWALKELAVKIKGSGKPEDIPGNSIAGVIGWITKNYTAGSGTPGQAATITVGEVTTGEAGTEASVSNSGSNTAAVFDFTIPKGDKGDPGQDGEDGADGKSITAITLTTDTSGKVTGGTATLSDTSSVSITVTQSES